MGVSVETPRYFGGIACKRPKMFEEHPDVFAFRRVEERQEVGIDCPDCLRSFGHIVHCKILKRYLSARAISITLEDFNMLRLDGATVAAILGTTVSDVVRQTCQDEMEQGRKCGWKFLD
jgi:hypothetical protein